LILPTLIVLGVDNVAALQSILNHYKFEKIAMRETILKILAEGGAITLFGQRRGEAWVFALEIADSFADEDKPVGANDSPMALTWEEALEKLNRYPWHALHPELVHPDFTDDVRAALASQRATGSFDSYNDKIWNKVVGLSSTGTDISAGSTPQGGNSADSQLKLSIVYVLTNAAMPGIIKIGRTSQAEANLRIAQLYTTGVPVPFDLEYACKVPNSEEVEKASHVAFAPHRVNPKREFFTMEAGQAIAILKLLHKEDATKEVAAQPDNLDPESVLAAKQVRAKRPPMNFQEMGIVPGSVLTFTDGDAMVTVVGPKKIEFEGNERSLTAVTRQLLGLEYSVQPSPYWSLREAAQRVV
jgi:hypothetical protein